MPAPKLALTTLVGSADTKTLPHVSLASLQSLLSQCTGNLQRGGTRLLRRIAARRRIASQVEIQNGPYHLSGACHRRKRFSPSSPTPLRSVTWTLRIGQFDYMADVIVFRERPRDHVC
jgi:hypothetical protein